jgi:hypothetical protein
MVVNLLKVKLYQEVKGSEQALYGQFLTEFNVNGLVSEVVPIRSAHTGAWKFMVDGRRKSNGMPASLMFPRNLTLEKNEKNGGAICFKVSNGNTWRILNKELHVGDGLLMV